MQLTIIYVQRFSHWDFYNRAKVYTEIASNMFNILIIENIFISLSSGSGKLLCLCLGRHTPDFHKRNDNFSTIVNVSSLELRTKINFSQG